MTATQKAPELATIPVEAIDVEQGHNPRTSIDEAQLKELVRSIREYGIVQAITVRTGEDGRYVVVAGHRRLAAAKQVGLDTVPALIRADNGNLAAALVENLIRADLDLIEEAQALSRLAKAENLKRKELAERIGKSVGYVGERLRLLDLPERCQAHFATGDLTLASQKPLRQIAKRAPEVAATLADYAVE